MSSDLAIDVRGLTKAFGGRIVVDHIDLAVPRGQVCGFLGPNGSGKTTTIRMLCGLLEVDAGEGTCLGYDIRREARRIKLRVGYMTQRFGLYEDLSIAENLDFTARVYRLDNRKQRVADALERLGLTSAQGTAGGHAVGRLEAAPRSGRLSAARARAAAARRADGRGRPEGATRLLARDPRARGRRHHGAGQHALHGRGRALSSARLHLVRQDAGGRHRRRSDRAGRAQDVGRERSAARRRARAGRAARLDGGALRHQPARQQHRTTTTFRAGWRSATRRWRRRYASSRYRPASRMSSSH